MSVLSTIAERTSIRSYLPDRVPTDELESLVRAGREAEALTSARIELHLVADGAQIESEVKGILGDYGRVIHAPHYIVQSAEEADHYLVDAGYRFEQLILEATRRGLGTCWVGGFFREPSLRAAVGLDAKRRIVALTPVGRADTRPNLVGRIVRGWVRASTRKPVEEMFFWQRHGQPLPERVLRERGEIIEAARRAPSWANRQPWRFVLTETSILVYKQERQIKEGKDYHLVDCGITMAHVHLAARELGVAGQWHLDAGRVPGAEDAELVGRYVLGTR